jgi:hypothetical protein
MTKGPFQPAETHKNTRNHMSPKEDAASIRLKQKFFDGKATYQEPLEPVRHIINTQRSEEGIVPICTTLSQEVILGQ